MKVARPLRLPKNTESSEGTCNSKSSEAMNPTLSNLSGPEALRPAQVSSIHGFVDYRSVTFTWCWHRTYGALNYQASTKLRAVKYWDNIIISNPLHLGVSIGGVESVQRVYGFLYVKVKRCASLFYRSRKRRSLEKVTGRYLRLRGIIIRRICRNFKGMYPDCGSNYIVFY